MSTTMLTATNTLSQLQKQMDVISHNIANVDTTGYKKQSATFTDLLVQQFQNQPDVASEIGRLTPNGIRQGSGAKLAHIMTVMTQGGLKSTERKLDTAFTKEGQFFRISVQTETGMDVQYTRDGSFYLTPVSNNELMLVTSDGNPVLDENNDLIVINGQAKEYKIDPNGSMIVSMANGNMQSFNLGVSLVNKPQFLELKGNNLLGLPKNIADLNVGIDEIVMELNGPDRDQISIEQGSLEQSNVDLSKEMTDLIQVQRSYQFQTRSINMADQMMGLINGIR
jgi:flagellar basal-body rod protein FlgG